MPTLGRLTSTRRMAFIRAREAHLIGDMHQVAVNLVAAENLLQFVVSFSLTIFSVRWLGGSTNMEKKDGRKLKANGRSTIHFCYIRSGCVEKGIDDENSHDHETGTTTGETSSQLQPPDLQQTTQPANTHTRKRYENDARKRTTNASGTQSLAARPQVRVCLGWKRKVNGTSDGSDHRPQFSLRFG